MVLFIRVPGVWMFILKRRGTCTGALWYVEQKQVVSIYLITKQIKKQIWINLLFPRKYTSFIYFQAMPSPLALDKIVVLIEIFTCWTGSQKLRIYFILWANLSTSPSSSGKVTYLILCKNSVLPLGQMVNSFLDW